jgi:hypothetical protein
MEYQYSIGYIFICITILAKYFLWNHRIQYRPFCIPPITSLHTTVGWLAPKQGLVTCWPKERLSIVRHILCCTGAAERPRGRVGPEPRDARHLIDNYKRGILVYPKVGNMKLVWKLILCSLRLMSTALETRGPIATLFRSIGRYYLPQRRPYCKQILGSKRDTWSKPTHTQDSDHSMKMNEMHRAKRTALSKQPVSLIPLRRVH